MPAPDLLKAASIAQRMLEARRLLKRVLSNYDAVVGPWRDALARRPEGFMAAGLAVAKQLELDGHGEAIVLVISAMADLSDASASDPLRR